MLDEQLVGEARERRKQRMDARERVVDSASALAVPRRRDRHRDLRPRRARRRRPRWSVGLVVGYAVVSRVRFEFGDLLHVGQRSSSSFRCFSSRRCNLVPLLAALARRARRAPGLRPRGVGTAIAGSRASATPGSASARCSCSPRFAPGEPSLDHIGDLRCSRSPPRSLSDFAWAAHPRSPASTASRSGRSSSICAGTDRVDAILSRVAFVIALAAVQEPLVLLTIAPLVWLLDDLLARPQRALRRDARAAPRLPRHRDAARRRRRVRRRLHGRALPLRRRAGARRRRRSWACDKYELPGARVRGPAPRRRQDRDPEGDPPQAGRPHRQRVRGDEDPHDRGPVHARPRRRPARRASARSSAPATSAGTARATPTASRARRSRWPRASSSSATPTTR